MKSVEESAGGSCRLDCFDPMQNTTANGWTRLLSFHFLLELSSRYGVKTQNPAPVQIPMAQKHPGPLGCSAKHGNGMQWQSVGPSHTHSILQSPFCSTWLQAATGVPWGLADATCREKLIPGWRAWPSSKNIHKRSTKCMPKITTVDFWMLTFSNGLACWCRNSFERKRCVDPGCLARLCWLKCQRCQSRVLSNQGVLCVGFSYL